MQDEEGALYIGVGSQALDFVTLVLRSLTIVLVMVLELVKVGTSTYFY